MHKLSLAILVALGGAAALSACGGSSKSTFTEPEGGGPSTGASSSQGGSVSNEAGADTGSGGSGSSMGGKTGGGGSGTGGSTVVPMTPDPAVREGCDAYCAGAVEPACNEDTLADCLFGCRAIANSVACNALYGELFECARDATFSCNAEGDPVPEGCEVEYASAGLCVLSNPDETIEAPCQSFCDAQEAAECTNSTPASECTYGCQLASALIPACTEDWRTFVACAAEAEVTCSDAGDAVPGGCEADYLRYLACYVEAGQ